MHVFSDHSIIAHAITLSASGLSSVREEYLALETRFVAIQSSISCNAVNEDNILPNFASGEAFSHDVLSTA